MPLRVPYSRVAASSSQQVLEARRKPLKMQRSRRQKVPYWTRVDLLIKGFCQQQQARCCSIVIPSAILRVVFEMYYSAHGEWLNQNLTIQIADSDDRDLYLVGVGVRDDFNLAFSRVGACRTTEFPSYNRHNYGAVRKYRPVWRLYACATDHCFTLHSADVASTSDVARKGEHGFLGMLYSLGGVFLPCHVLYP